MTSVVEGMNGAAAVKTNEVRSGWVHEPATAGVRVGWAATAEMGREKCTATLVSGETPLAPLIGVLDVTEIGGLVLVVVVAFGAEGPDPRIDP
jgi:hypothetical protein